MIKTKNLLVGGIKKSFDQNIKKNNEIVPALKKTVRPQITAEYHLSHRNCKSLHISEIIQQMRTTGLLPEKAKSQNQ